MVELIRNKLIRRMMMMMGMVVMRMMMKTMHLRLTRLRMSAGGRPGWSNLSTILKRKNYELEEKKHILSRTVSQKELLFSEASCTFVNRRLVTECL